MTCPDELVRDCRVGCMKLSQAFVGLERGEMCVSDPVFPDDDGLELLPFTGECLTYNGEINKLAVNVAFGRYSGRARAKREHILLIIQGIKAVMCTLFIIPGRRTEQHSRRQRGAFGTSKCCRSETIAVLR